MDNPFYPIPSGMEGQIDQIQKLIESGQEEAAKAVMLKQLPQFKGIISNLRKVTPGASLADMACPMGVMPDWKRPVVVDRKASTTITVANGAGFVAGILAAVFASDANRQYFLGNGSGIGAQVKDRTLAGLKAKWYVTMATAAAAMWTEEQIKPVRDALYRCTLEVFSSGSNTPELAATPLGEYRGEGKQFPKGLLHELNFSKDSSYLKVSNPGTVIDLVNNSGANVLIQAELELSGLFIVPPK